MKKIFLAILFISGSAWAYPDFISYGYNTCITCHFNSHGYGPLTDYGRALFSQEIAARNFWTPKSVSNEEIAAGSGFIPGVESPYWIKPGLKYRGLWMQTNPGTEDKKTRWIRMQQDFNLVLSIDPENKTILALNYGLLHEPKDYYGKGQDVSAVSREQYLRTFIGEKLLVAAGLMDIAYGLRTGDHTALNRGSLGLGQDDQVHGALAQWFEEKWDATLHYFVGNMNRDEAARKKGFSVMSEYLTSEKNKVGFSFMKADTETAKATRVAIHDRWGIPNAPGSSVIGEIGIRKDELTGKDATQGMYWMAQAMLNITRGYNILSTIERNQTELKTPSAENARWSLGLLMFPLQRTEVRLGMTQAKGYSPTGVSQDVTVAQGQLHVSW